MQSNFNYYFKGEGDDKKILVGKSPIRVLITPKVA